MENLLNLDWVSLQLDVFNAFNELDRAIIFKLFEQIPQALAYVQYKYGQAAALHMLNGCKLQNSTGLLQGDPLASMLFALVASTNHSFNLSTY
jgi:hypothetical protein